MKVPGGPSEQSQLSLSDSSAAPHPGHAVTPTTPALPAMPISPPPLPPSEQEWPTDLGTGQVSSG